MVKVRAMGTIKDLKEYKKSLYENTRYRVLRVSDPFPNKGTNRNFRIYAELDMQNRK